MAAAAIAAAIVAVAALSVGAVGSAAAQTGATGGASQPDASQSAKVNVDALKPISEYETTVTYNGMSVETLKGTDVKGANGEALGKIDTVLADQHDKIEGVTLSSGGSSAAKPVVVPMASLQYDRDAKAFKTSLSKNDLASLPEWKR
jgi:hypothetical protein